MFKNIQFSLPVHVRHTMDPKFIFVLFFVEIGSLVFTILHIAAPEIHVYSAYNQIPVVYEVPPQTYSCFSSINYCIYEHKDLRFLKGLDLIFISIIIVCYGCLFTIILCQWENVKIRRSLKITWYGALELFLVLTLALHVLLMIILLERDTANTDQCNKQNRLVRAENLFNNFVLSVIELTYVAFDLVNRQASPVHTAEQAFQYEIPAAEPLRLPSSQKNYRISQNWN